jgi:hypothetical protein
VADIANALSVLRELESIAPFVFKLAPVPAVFFTPFVTIHIAPVVLRIVAPGVLRTLRFYGHLVPIVGGYVKCLAWDSKRVTLPDTSRNVQKKMTDGDGGQNGDVSNDDADGDGGTEGGEQMNEHDRQLALDDEVQVSLFLVIFGYFWLFLVILVILVRAIRMTTCFVYSDCGTSGTSGARKR